MLIQYIDFAYVFKMLSIIAEWCCTSCLFHTVNCKNYKKKNPVNFLVAPNHTLCSFFKNGRGKLILFFSSSSNFASLEFMKNNNLLRLDGFICSTVWSSANEISLIKCDEEDSFMNLVCRH